MITILVVEDDPKFNKIVCAFLNGQGYRAAGCALAAINGFHMVLHQEFLRRGMLDTHVQLVINVMEKSLLLEKLPVCLKQQTRGTACRCFAIW